MKTKYYFLAALAGLTLASCSSDDFIAETPPVDNPEGMTPILFNSFGRGMTRADFIGADAAELLNNQFVVAGYKGSKTEWQSTANGDILKSSIVFDNYFVKYEANTAHTTESNSDNWEYVGKTPIHWATENGITQQTIKYWDYSVPQYDFIAWSTGKATAIYEKPSTGIPAGNVYVSAITPATATGTTSTIAYSFEGEADDLKDCYIADLVTVYKKAKEGDDDTYNVVWKGYQQPVTLRFRQLGTKIRIGIYETVPGYSVKDVKFYSEAANALLDESTTGNKEKNESAKIFTTVANGIFKEGKYIVTFPTVDKPTNTDNNQAHIKFEALENAEQKTTIDWGKLDYTIRESGESSNQPIYLGRTSNTASFANKDKAEQNYYEVFLPNEAGTNLNLRVNYTLESIDGSQETIEVKGATAQVPSIYTTWKPGYAYTYLFKISDKTNGHTGDYNPLYPDDVTVNSDPVGLYPITFDAVVVNAEEDKTQETITTISTPSITTYQKGSNVVNQNEYKSGSDYPIFVTVNDGGEATYQAVEPAPAVDSPVAGYYTTVDVYTAASGVAVENTTYYSKTNDTYNAVSITTGQSVEGYYIKTEEYTACGSNDVAASGKTYYRRISTLESGKVVTLMTSGDGMAALYTLPSDKTYTEANVVDAMQMQDDDATANTVKGRSGLVLTEATSASPELVTKIQYGVNGNEIDLTEIPSGSSSYSANALKFTPAAGTSYAFVYTKKAANTANNKEIFEAIAYNDATVTTKYRYKLNAITTAGDAQKDVVYFAPNNDNKLEKKSVFIGQGVNNLFRRTGDSQPYTYPEASGYAVTGTDYYYTLDGGTTHTKAKNIDYANFNATENDQLYVKKGAYYEPKTETEPVDGTAYYYKNGNDYEYCVILPEQTATSWKTLDNTKYETPAENYEITGMTYFDKYTKNDGVYYTKIIKVQ